MKVKFFSTLCVDSSPLHASMHCHRQHEISVPRQLQYPGYATAHLSTKCLTLHPSVQTALNKDVV